jgi:3-hydroxybutyryl-CoA dehydrogenase
MVAAGRLGRKAGRGYYDYSGEPYRPTDPEPPKPGGGDGRRVTVAGAGRLADELRERAAAAGFVLGGGAGELILEAGTEPLREEEDGPRVVLCAGSSLVTRDPRACGFHLVPPLESCRLVQLTRTPESGGVKEAEGLFRALGFHVEWVGDAPGLVLGRIVCQLVNEAAFAIGEGAGSAEDVDAGLELGLSHPRGPVTWGEAIGLDQVLATLEGLWQERREERYRPAPLLRRAVALGLSLSQV